ncbi:MAG: Fic family protein, partial [Acidimicrobiia bacterium]
EAWVNTSHPGLPIIATLALAHYQFEALHPFSDGNGRIGRLVIVLQLMRDGHLTQPLLTISPWLEQRRRDYQEHLASVSQTGDFDPWIRFFATGVRTQSDAAVAKIDQLIAFQAHVREIVQQNRIRGIGRDIAEDLIGRPIVTPTFAAEHYDKSYPAANSGIQRLVAAGLLREATGRRYDRVFVSDEIMRIIEF